jgi:hypothetical protein
VDIKVAGAYDLGAYNFTLSWDPNILDITSVSNGTFLGSTGNTVVCDAPQKALGSLTFGCHTSGAGAGPNGAGVLGTVQFTILSTGTTQMTLSAALASTTGQPLDINTGDGIITVQ